MHAIIRLITKQIKLNQVMDETLWKNINQIKERETFER
jgi:hypothetical protein